MKSVRLLFRIAICLLPVCGCSVHHNRADKLVERDFSYTVTYFHVTSPEQPDVPPAPELVEELKYQLASPLLSFLKDRSFDSARLVLSDTVLKQEDGTHLNITADIRYQPEGADGKTASVPFDEFTDIPEYPFSDYCMVKFAFLPYRGLLKGDLYVTEAEKPYRIPVNRDHMLIPIGTGKYHSAGNILQKKYWLSLVEE